MTKIYALVPVYNRLQYTLQCLTAFNSQTYQNYQVVVIDSASTDGSLPIIKKRFPQTKIIKGNSSWWWTQATQAGVDYVLKHCSPDDFILLMNNDCYFKKHYLATLIKTAKKYPKHIIGSLCVSAKDKNRVVEAGIRFDWERGYVYAVTSSFSSHHSAYKRIEVINNIDALPGKGTLIPISVFRELTGFAVDKLPHYVADYEFTNRAKRYGFDLLVATKAVVIHHWEATGNYYTKGQKVGFKSILGLLFGRKSMNNLLDWYHFVILACPRRLIPKNLYLLANRVWKLALETKYLRPIRHLFTMLLTIRALLLKPLVPIYQKLRKI